jgi:transcriptional regulator GlxA family with amidase domain
MLEQGQASSVQALFEDDHTTHSHFLIGARLSRAYRMLSDPRLSCSIITIASTTRFSDLPHLSRVSRRRYGTRPSDVRAAAMREPRRERV